MPDQKLTTAQKQTQDYKPIRLRRKTWDAILKKVKPHYGATQDAIIRSACGLPPYKK